MKLIDKILYTEIKANWGPLFLVFVLMILVVAFDAIGPWPFKILIDNVLGGTPIDVPPFLASFHALFSDKYLLGFFAVFIYFGSTFALSVVEYLRSAYVKNVIKKITANFSKSAFKNLESLAMGFYKKQQIGDYVYRLSYDVAAIGELLEEGILPFLTSLLYLAITITVMVFINVKLTLLSLVVLPFLAFGLYSFNASVTRATKRSEFWSSATFSFVEEALTHLKIIQAFRQERRKSGEFGEKTDISLQSDITMYRLDFLLTLLVGVVIAISYSIIILYGIDAVFSGTLTTGLLIVFIFYLDNLTNPILSLIYAVTITKQSYIKITRMQEFFTAKTHLDYTQTGVSTITNATVRFENVSFKGDKGRRILNNVSFTIEPYKQTVIFGANGSGKTTIINLLLRFIDKPTSGKILLGGVNLNEYNLSALRESVAYVPQDIALFNDSIKNNVAFGNPKSTDTEIREALRLANADEFVKRLPKTIHFRVGEGGNYLSGGQKQKIMLARALLKKSAKILLFDETLSALDVKSRREILDSIYHFSKGKTSIIVSNIFEIATAADNVIVLNKGRVLYSGKSSHLPHESALYRMILESDEGDISLI